MTILFLVIPAKAGIQTDFVPGADVAWTPAFGVPANYYFAGCPFAGVTERCCD
jgi:hypothetical protein